MPLVPAHELDIDTGSPQIYCGMDSCVTAEILGELKTLLPGHNAPELQGFRLIYDFVRALQAPAMEMMLRGWRIDPWAREAGITELRRRLTRLSYIIDSYAAEIWSGRNTTKPSNDHPTPKLLNPNSTKQLQAFFYEALKIPPIIRHKDGKETRPMDRDVLEHLEAYFLARPIISAILAYRDNEGQLEVLECEIDDDWRMRTSYNPAHTSTGRWSSSEFITGSGRNLQNIEESLRYIFIADKGKKLLGADLEQAESRENGWLCWILFGDPTYLDAVESGDQHTYVARLIWPNLDWNGDLAHDKKIASQIYYRHHSYREVAKRVTHGSEKGGGAPEIARQVRIPLPLVREAQNKIFTAFPCLTQLFTWVAGQLQREHYLINVFGRRRDFFGRPDSNDTIKEGIAYMSQSPTADRLNLGLWRIWKHMGPDSPTPFELLAQLHDAVYGQRSELDTDETTIATQVQAHLDIPMTFNGRHFTVPSEVKSGWCWATAHQPDETGAYQLTHPDGLMKFTGHDSRVRAPLRSARTPRPKGNQSS